MRVVKVSLKTPLTIVAHMKIRGLFTNVRNHRSFQFFSKRKQRHETRYEEHLASKLDRSCWIRILLEKVCCLHECRPVCRSSVFEHICSVLEKTGPTHIIGSKLFTTGRVSPVISAAPVSFGFEHVSSTIFSFSRSVEALRSTHRDDRIKVSADFCHRH